MGKNPIIWRMRKQSIAGLLSKAGEGGKLQPRKYSPRNVSILLNHEYFVPRKLPAIRYLFLLLIFQP